MSVTRSVGPARALIPLSLAALVACGPSEEVQQKLAELETVSAQKDSLLLTVADYGRLVSDISAELAKVEVRGRELAVSTESPLAATRDSMIEKIRYLTERVDQSARQLRASRRRIEELTQLSDSLRTTLETTIANYESVIESQRERIAALTTQVAELETRNAELAAEVDTLTTEANTVYYVVGTKDELLQKGLVQKEGGARFLFIFGKRGETLVPARDLEPSEFTAIDKREVREIPLPEPDEEYTIASRHDLSYLETPPDEKGKIHGSIRIAEPDRFWSTSKFLIIVRG